MTPITTSLSLLHHNIQLTPLRNQDIFLIKDWRNAQLKFLRQKSPLSDQDQLHYYQNTILPASTQDQPPLILFSILDASSNDCIGYGGLVHIDWDDRRAEVSFLLNPSLASSPDSYQSIFSSFLSLIKSFAFSSLGLNKIFTETFDIRPLHISILESNNFLLEGRLRQHSFIDNHYVDSLVHSILSSDFFSHESQ